MSKNDDTFQEFLDSKAAFRISCHKKEHHQMFEKKQISFSIQSVLRESVEQNFKREKEIYMPAHIQLKLVQLARLPLFVCYQNAPDLGKEHFNLYSTTIAFQSHETQPIIIGKHIKFNWRARV
ncbi:hypothetical protein TNCT_589341 [Trichonephila clavata]|uniref:Uncharacterized protein n=1 Tax=Trichonephila clavata TaxID=2740835 RepID=A0A8X6HL08_TRICU|nr:hypothetical protein TNCT_589341 [Trichonephila clavata]